MVFAGEAQKSRYFDQTTLIFDQKSRKYPKNSEKYFQIHGFLGFLGGDLCGDLCGALCGDLVCTHRAADKPRAPQDSTGVPRKP